MSAATIRAPHSQYVGGGRVRALALLALLALLVQRWYLLYLLYRFERCSYVSIRQRM
jgi:hypothetical protein